MEEKYNGPEYRSKIISKLELSKQFAIRQHLSNCDKLTKEQAIEFLKDAIVQLAHKDYTYRLIMKDDWFNG